MATQTRPPETGAPDPGLGTGLRGTFYELRRVIWPTRQELFRMTSVVVATVVVVAAFIGVVDIILSRVTQVLYGS